MALNPLGLSYLSSLILAVLLAVPRPLFAATLIVTNLGDSGMNGQLRTLISLAIKGDTIVIPPGTITLSGSAGDDVNGGGDLDVLENLTIVGAGPGVTIIDGAGIDRVFDIDPFSDGLSVAITGMTIRNGNSGNTVGGGIRNGSLSTLHLTNVTVSGNTASFSFGGGISNESGSMTLNNVTVSGNTAGMGQGGIRHESGGMALTNVTVSGNTAAGDTGGIGNGSGSMTLNNVTVSGNAAAGDAGGIGNGSGSMTLNNVTVSGNAAGSFGGGIASTGPFLNLVNVTVSGNSAGNAGGIASLGTLLLTNVTVSGNSATTQGGGIVNFGPAEFTNVTVSNNSSGGQAGGIDNLGTATFINATFSGNTAASLGGGILNQAALFLTNVTLSGNSAIVNGGGLFNTVNATAELINTIIANSPAGGNCSGPKISLGHNLDSGATCGFNQPGDRSNAAPLLGPLQDNGGPTQTHALLPGSPAIDAGDNLSCPNTDQRSFPRPRDGNGNSIETCDIGAYEASPPPVSVTNFGDTGGAGQLRTLINSAAPCDTMVIPAGTITLTAQAGGTLQIFQCLTLQGAGPDITIIDGNGIGSVLEVLDASVVISGVTIRGGSAEAGASSGAGPEGTRNGAAPGFGGGISISSLAPVIVMNTVVVGNSASEGGGGIAIAAGPGPVKLIGVTISGNSTPLLGGGIFNGGAPLTLINTTVSGNSAGINGGGIANSAAGSVMLNNVTLGSNSVNTSGGGIFNGGGIVQIKNSILANSLSGGNCSGPIASLGHNLDSGTTCGFNQPGDRSNAAPLLGPLQDNGGPTQTHALLPGSPAIDAGDPAGCTDSVGTLLTTDQRGFPRPRDGNGDGIAVCDIGAYEVSGLIADPATAFVTRLYEEVLGRAPDPVGLQGHLASIQQFGSVVTTVLAFFHSPEFLFRTTTDGEFLTILYRTFLNRAPDAAGFTAFLGDLAGGCRTRDDLLGIFIRSQEFQGLASFLPPLEPLPAFVTTLYILTLGRGPDQAGLQGFVTQLSQTRQVLPVVQGFLGSSEFLDRNTTNTEYVTVLFGVFLDRVPDCPGLAFFVARLTQGTATRAQIAAEFAASAEFQAIQKELFP